MATMIGDKLVLESVPCWNCNGTKLTNQGILCSEWNRKVRGRLGGHCPHCGATNRHNHKVVGYEIVECSHCSGTGIEKEDSCNRLTRNIEDQITYKVYRLFKNGKNEDNLRYSSGGFVIGGCTDYGASHSMTDEELIDKVREGNHWYYRQVMDDNKMLCREISIFVKEMRYDIKAFF